MSITRAELQDAARKAFGAGGLVPDQQESWRLITDMGWLAMSVPEHLGGLGLGPEAAGAIHMELGRALSPGPIISQMLVITALCAAGHLAERDELLGRALGGEVFTASLHPSPGAAVELAVPDADRATYILVAEPEAVLLVPVDALGVTVTPRTTWDETRRLFEVNLRQAQARLVLAEGEAANALHAKLTTQLLAALAADSLGGAAAILEHTIDYLNTRHQFGRPLAMFQALKHRCADMRTRLVAAEALLWSSAAQESDAIGTGALKAHAARLYADVAEDAVQLHGGIGLTHEHHCHLFLKRALLNLNLGGSGDDWEEAAGRRASLQPQACHG